MGLSLMAGFGEAAWIAAGAALAIGGMALRRKLGEWRESRIAAEWDPY